VERSATRGKRAQDPRTVLAVFVFRPGGAKENFRSELLRMLRAHGVEFHERYVFE
jgi:NADPH-dependent 2,4-dienoyl-CoA reductase/sulfur reductase-like enzyme